MAGATEVFAVLHLSTMRVWRLVQVKPAFAQFENLLRAEQLARPKESESKFRICVRGDTHFIGSMDRHMSFHIA